MEATDCDLAWNVTEVPLAMDARGISLWGFLLGIAEQVLYMGQLADDDKVLLDNGGKGGGGHGLGAGAEELCIGGEQILGGDVIGQLTDDGHIAVVQVAELEFFNQVPCTAVGRE